MLKIKHNIKTSALDSIKKKYSKSQGGVDIGFFSTAKYPDGASLPMVAATLEYGSSTIPPRPYMRLTSKSCYKKWKNSIATDLKNGIIDSNRLFSRVGKRALGDIVHTINALQHPPNAPATIKKKGSSNPLIDTGFLQSNVAFKVRRAK